MDLSTFERGEIMGVFMASASIITVAELLSVPIGSLSKIMTSYKAYCQTTSVRQNSGRKIHLTNWGIRRIVTKKRRPIQRKWLLSQINIHRSQYESVLCEENCINTLFWGIAAISKTLVSDVSRTCDVRTIQPGLRKHVLFSNESYFSLFPTTWWVYL